MSVGGISGKYTTRPSSSFVKVIHSPNLEFGVNKSSSMTSSRVCSALKGSGTLSTHSGLMSTWECELCGPSPYKSSVQISLCFTELGALTLVFTSIGSLCILAISNKVDPTRPGTRLRLPLESTKVTCTVTSATVGVGAAHIILL